MFTVEQLLSDAMSVFKGRLISALVNSPLHDTAVAVVELCAYHTESFEGAICLSDLTLFTTMQNLQTTDVFVREQSKNCLELWLVAPVKEIDFDTDPTPVQ